MARATLYSTLYTYAGSSNVPGKGRIFFRKRILPDFTPNANSRLIRQIVNMHPSLHLSIHSANEAPEVLAYFLPFSPPLFS